ncbi:hypothetical protein Enr10x_09860 [Gimesia panareensis]|uniref:Uncharacterized protein n=1 Tax=Gimesia panareensis TaxID=2527978 RepID=A0A518A1P3_9PLAN|nr:hypothetical protein Enr10x_09860 [Gimesia panareensis]QDU48633.1 hypothetical protein Pan110_09480 [Gimesia panareensis]
METIVCIPMPLKGPGEFRRKLVEVSGLKYLYAADMLMSAEPSFSSRGEFYERDEQISLAFQLGGQGTITGEDVAELDTHQSVLYLIWSQTGLDELYRLHALINVCLDCGGLGVKFENSGVAHSAREWRAKNFAENTLDLLQSHVMLVGSETHFYSTGMHIFGLPDAAVPTTVDNREAGYLLTEFNHYQMCESPEFEDGHTFSTSADAPYYRIFRKDDWINADEECFENPFGRYLLEPVASTS